MNFTTTLNFHRVKVKVDLELVNAKPTSLLEFGNYRKFSLPSASNSYDMPAKKCITDRQWQLLLHHMETNPDFAKGVHPNLATLTVRYESRTKWNELMCRLNALSPSCKKSEKGWRDYWNQAKYKARTKACTIRKQLKAIMKGERINLLVLTKNEQRVLRLLGIPLPEFRVLESPQDIIQPYASEPYASPPDLPLPESPPPPEESPGLAAPLKPKVRSELEECDAKSESDSSYAPLIEMCPPPTKLAWARAMKRKAAYESTASSTRVYSAPYGHTRKRYRPAPPAAEWVRHIEERRIAVEEKSSRALEGIQANTEFCASALQGIHIAQERMNRTLQGIQCALEASARALQERLS